MLKCQCCKQHFLDQGSCIPILFPSQEMRSLPGHSVAFLEPIRKPLFSKVDKFSKNFPLAFEHPPPPSEFFENSCVLENMLHPLCRKVICLIMSASKTSKDCTGVGWPGSLKAQTKMSCTGTSKRANPSGPKGKRMQKGRDMPT